VLYTKQSIQTFGHVAILSIKSIWKWTLLHFTSNNKYLANLM